MVSRSETYKGVASAVRRSRYRDLDVVRPWIVEGKNGRAKVLVTIEKDPGKVVP